MAEQYQIRIHKKEYNLQENYILLVGRYHTWCYFVYHAVLQKVRDFHQVVWVDGGLVEPLLYDWLSAI